MQQQAYVVQINNEENFDIDQVASNIQKDLHHVYTSAQVRRLTVADVEIHNAQSINNLRNKCHNAAYAAGWWHVNNNNVFPVEYFDRWPNDADKKTDVRQLPSDIFKFWVGTKLCLTHSEVSEAMEGHRKGIPDDKLPHRTMLEVELADAVIRIMDLAGGLNLDVGGAIIEKLAFNATREDHKAEVRAQSGGKSY